MEMLPPAPSVGDVPDDDETAPYDHSGDPFLDGDATVDYEGDGDARTASSRFKTNPVVDGQLVPPTRKRKYRSEEPAATPPPRARRPRRAVNYDGSEPDADDDEDLELAPPDGEDGWD